MAHTCKVCTKTCSTPSELESHFKINHCLSSSSPFMCGLPNCNVRFSNVKSYVRHIQSQLHISDRVVPQAQEALESKSEKKCPYCDFTSSNSSSFRSHKRRKHWDMDQSAGTSATVQVLNGGTSLEVYKFISDTGNTRMCTAEPFVPDSSPSISSEEVSAEAGTYEIRPDELKQKFIKLFSTLNSVYHVPQSVLQHIIDNYKYLLHVSDSLVCQDVAQKFERLQLDATGAGQKIIQSALADSVASLVHCSNGPLRSAYIRQQNFNSATTYVPAISHYLGTNAENKHRVYHTVSVERSLKQLFSDDSVFEQYIENMSERHAHTEMRDIYDGSLYQGQVALSDPTTIMLLVYTDDLELCNPIGSAKTVHKVTNIYIAIGNLHPWTRTKGKFLLLALTCREKDVAYFGLPKVLKPLIKELSQLEAGGMVLRGKNVKVKVLPLLGDNLGTHTITGFLENFSTSTYFCRYCEEKRSEWQCRWDRAVEGTPDSGDEDEESEDDGDSEAGYDYETDSGDDLDDVVEDNDSVISDSDCFEFADSSVDGVEVELDCVPETAPLRTEEDYSQCVSAVAALPRGSSVKGIVADCQFNKLNCYHCAKRSPPCVAHDLHEGIIPKDVGLSLACICKKNSITVEFLNRKLRSYPFLGVDRSDRPAKISENFKICGNAVQNGVLLRFLPLVLGPHIKDKSDPVWEMILLLREIVQTVTSPVISKSGLPKLNQMIRTYLFLRRKLFPNVKLRPKHHYLEHYPLLIEIFGPLMRSSTLAFEAKHPFFKATLRAKKSCKNVTKLLSNEHQLMMSNKTSSMLVDNFPIVVCGVTEKESELSPDFTDAITTFFGEAFSKVLTYSTTAIFRGTEYSRGEVILHPLQSSSYLELCHIQYLLTIGKDCYAAGFRSRGTEIQGLGIHRVTQTASVTLLNLSKLKDYSSYPVYKLYGKEVIVLKHRPL